eukprot:Skav208606  [mRNA]  locus=scaffold598:411139:421047:+ [translate_table: standard]
MLHGLLHVETQEDVAAPLQHGVDAGRVLGAAIVLTHLVGLQLLFSQCVAGTDAAEDCSNVAETPVLGIALRLPNEETIAIQ